MVSSIDNFEVELVEVDDSDTASLPFDGYGSSPEVTVHTWE